MAPGLCRFRPHRQPMGVAEGIRGAFRKAREWGRPLYLACMDVNKAFDSVRRWVAEAALLAHNAPAWLVPAVLRDLVGQKCWPMVVGVAADMPVGVLKGGRQGAPGTPMLWNVVMSGIVFRCLEASEGETPVEWCDALGVWQRLVFADNLFILADCPRKLQSRYATVWGGPRMRDTCFGTDSSELLHNSEGSVEIRLPDGEALREKDTISVLGISVDASGRTLTAVSGREVAAQSTWFKWRGALLSRAVCAQDGGRKLYNTVGAA